MTCVRFTRRQVRLAGLVVVFAALLNTVTIGYGAAGLGDFCPSASETLIGEYNAMIEYNSGAGGEQPGTQDELENSEPNADGFDDFALNGTARLRACGDYAEPGPAQTLTGLNPRPGQRPPNRG